MRDLFLLSIFIPLSFFTLEAKGILDDDPVLIIKNDKLGRKIFVEEGQKIKLWDKNKSTVTGEFQSIVGDTLILNSKGKELKNFIFDISKLRLYSTDGSKRIIGSTIATVGAAALFFGGASLVAGLAALAEDNLAAIILVAVLPLGFGGYGLFKIGRRIRGKKHEIKGEWEMVPN